MFKKKQTKNSNVKTLNELVKPSSFTKDATSKKSFDEMDNNEEEL